MVQNSFVQFQKFFGDTWVSAPLHPDISLCAAQEPLASFSREAAAEEKDSREEDLWVASNVLQSLLSTASEPVLRDKRVLQASLPYPRFNPIGLSVSLWTLLNSVLELTSQFQWRKGKDHQCFNRRKMGLPAFMQISQFKEKKGIQRQVQKGSALSAALAPATVFFKVYYECGVLKHS